jgi:cobyrinic acid a,c-diamide synthase
MITALRGGSGKTILSVGLIAAWVKRSKIVAPFKKGPDYIDAGWLALSAGRPCHNLDSFLVSKTAILSSFFFNSRHCDIAVIEGNRGLYDGTDTLGHTSTAELAKLLKSPVILCLDCTKSTRTMAAIVLGCLQFDPGVCLKGVILNRIAGSRHESIIRENIEYHCGLPVVGAVPRLKDQNFPERHMGLIPTYEHGGGDRSVDAICEIASKYLDLDVLEHMACTAEPLGFDEPEATEQLAVAHRPEKDSPQIAVIRDSAFQFYYPENLEALISAGGSLVYISPFTDENFPSVDALYIGGGFPETHAEALAKNLNFMKTLKTQAENGLPIYAECGGLMYLGEKLVLKGKSYLMAGVLPLVFGLFQKPQGHGYSVVRVEKQNSFYPVGDEIKGHEFHYSKVLEWTKEKQQNLVFEMKRGTGIADGKDGFSYKNVLATYIHVHALGTPQWATALVRKAMEFKRHGKKNVSLKVK